jgi:hypothetical protein
VLSRVFKRQVAVKSLGTLLGSRLRAPSTAVGLRVTARQPATLPSVPTEFTGPASSAWLRVVPSSMLVRVFFSWSQRLANNFNPSIAHHSLCSSEYVLEQSRQGQANSMPISPEHI